MLSAFNILLFLLASFGGGAASFLILRAPKINEKELSVKMDKIMADGKEKGANFIKETREKMVNYKKQAEEENKHLAETMEKVKQIIQLKENSLQKRNSRIMELEKAISAEEQTMKDIKENQKKLNQQEIEKLLSLTGIGKEEAKVILMQNLTEDLANEKKTKLQKMVEDLKEEGHRMAVNILIGTIHKFTSPTSVETKTTTVTVAKDGIKGQLVGEKGENIIYIEEKLDVDVIFNDLPKTITISGYDLVKRQIATVALGKLCGLRTINKPIIDEKIKEAAKETENMIIQVGQKAADIVGLKNLDRELVKTIGRLKYRTSYGQNILKHSLEVSAFSAMLASELNADIEICKVAGFLHDIGKAIDHEVEGSHDALSKEILTKYHYSDEIIHAVYAHHEAEPCRTPEAMIVKAADALSAGRPGARQESLDKYLERLHELEAVACSFAGVQKTFAISAGREIRVIANAEEVDDAGVVKLANDIAGKIEEELNYPGKIKVNVIRRTHNIDYAK